MKTSQLIILGGLAAMATVAYLSVSTGPEPEQYAAAVTEERKKKDDFLKEDPTSPLLPESRAGFRGLNYFPPDLRYTILADLEPIAKKQVRILTTSTNEKTKYLEYAWATFELHEKENKLLILEVMDMGPNRGKLFLAFADDTSAGETYGGGRYLDLKKVPAATTIELDFNKAYNPYCAYNDGYSCPLPPSENILKVAIRAGEKNYK